jgi:uncharacterized membrane protein
MTPFQFFNQYSFFVMALFGLAVTVLLARILQQRKVANGLLLAGLAGMLIAAIVLRAPRASTIDTSSAAGIRSGLANAGKPTLVYFHSHY